MPPSPIRWNCATTRRIGTPGLVEALRQRLDLDGQRARLRHPGNACACSPSCRRSARALLGEALELPTIATWWCGQDARARARARQFRPHDDRPGLLDARCRSTIDEQTVLGATLDADASATTLRRAARSTTAAPSSARKPVTLSTTPVYVDGRLEPRPMTPARLCGAHRRRAGRSCPAASPASARRSTPTAIAMQRGGQAADVWVVSDKPVERDTLLPQDGEKLHAATCRAACPAAPPTI